MASPTDLYTLDLFYKIGNLEQLKTSINYVFVWLNVVFQVF